MIRLMKPDDERAVRTLILKYLKETWEQGGDFQPTIENAAAFTRLAIEGAAEMDPCLVCEEDGKVVGFLVARGLHFPGMQTREKSIRSWGSYVLPQFRGKRSLIMMLMVMGRLAKQKGYTQFIGFTHGTGYSERAMRVTKALVGLKSVGSVLVWSFKPPVEQTAGEETACDEQQTLRLE